MSGIRQGYRGWVAFTPTAASPIYVLCRLPGAQLAMPRNLDTLYPASNQPFGEINLADGLQFPTLNMPLVPMTGMATPWWTAAILNAWFKTRTNDDLSAIGNGGIDFADSSDAAGTGRFRCLNPKG